jgi:hypothetical protein
MADLHPETAEALRKRRTSFYLVGSAIAAAGMMLGTMPMFREMTPMLVARCVALAGAIVLAVGRFASDAFLRRILPARR